MLAPTSPNVAASIDASELGETACPSVSKLVGTSRTMMLATRRRLARDPAELLSRALEPESE
jgi:hypothetical protein